MDEQPVPGRRRVLVHVGAPKTGTTSVQNLLFAHREALAAQGILYPADRFDAHFLAALDLMELSWGGLERQAVGAWDRLAEQVRAWDDTVVISHEILATASRPQVRRALDSFGDAEVHVVLSARDLVRQIPAEWQENVKHRRTVRYHDFLDKITAPQRRGRLAAWFWGVQDVPDVLDRWGATLPPGHVHLITVPQPGAQSGLLWQRFATVFGIDAEQLTAEVERSNPSLGVAESALLRRVNARVADVLPNHHYRGLVRELLAHRTLSARPDPTRLSLPGAVRRWAEDLCATWVEVLATRGYDVVGSLEELRPAAAATLGTEEGFADPDAPDEGEVAAAAVDAVAALLQEAARLRDSEGALRAELAGSRAERDQAWAAAGERRVFRTKQRLVRAADHNAAARVGLAAYRRLRGRSS